MKKKTETMNNKSPLHYILVSSTSGSSHSPVDTRSKRQSECWPRKDLAADVRRHHLHRTPVYNRFLASPASPVPPCQDGATPSLPSLPFLCRSCSQHGKKFILLSKVFKLLSAPIVIFYLRPCFLFNKSIVSLILCFRPPIPGV